MRLSSKEIAAFLDESVNAFDREGLTEIDIKRLKRRITLLNYYTSKARLEDIQKIVDNSKKARSAECETCEYYLAAKKGM